MVRSGTARRGSFVKTPDEQRQSYPEQDAAVETEAEALQFGQSLLQIFFQIRGVLDAHGEPDQVICDSQPLALFG